MSTTCNVHDYFQALAGAWRSQVGATQSHAPSWPSLIPLAIACGEAGLIAQTVPPPAVLPAHVLRPLTQTLRLQKAQYLRRQGEIAKTFAVLGEARIEAILLKGWSIGRKYARPWCRPLGDVDLAVDPGDLLRAQAALRKVPGGTSMIDLHAGVPDVPDTNWRELYGRSVTVPLSGQQVRLLGPLDEAKQLIMHCWRHSARRAIWFCDVATAVESLPVDFPWNRLLNNNWDGGIYRAIIGLTRELLGARVNSDLAREHCVPSSWLRNTVLKCHATRLERALRGDSPDQFPRCGMQRIWGDPMRTVLRTGLSPFDSLAKIHLSGILCRPRQYAVRLCHKMTHQRRQQGVQMHEVRA